MDKISCIVADDHPIFRIGLVNVIKQNKKISLLGEAENGEQAIALIRQHKPQIAVLDIEMPLMNGLQVCEQVKKEKLSTKVLMLTLFKEADLYNKALEIGASGYLLKDNAVEELVMAIETVAEGKEYFSAALKESLIARKSHLIADPVVSELISKLTNTEKKILIFIAEQKTTKEIASKLFVSEKTIENHRYNIGKKLNLEGIQNGLMKFAIENQVYLK